MRKRWGFKACHQTSGARGEGQSRPWPALGPQGCLGTVWQRVQQCSFEIFLDPRTKQHVASLVAGCLARRCLVPVVGGLAPNKTDLQEGGSKFMIPVQALAAAAAAPRQGVAGCPSN